MRCSNEAEVFTLSDNSWQKALVALAYAVVGAVLVFGLYWAQKVIVPIALAIFLALILVKPVQWLQKVRVPRVPAVILVVSLVLVFLSGVGWAIMAQVQGLADELPIYTENVTAKVVSLRQLGKGRAFTRLETMAQEISGAWYDKLPRGKAGDSATATDDVASQAPPLVATAPDDHSQRDLLAALVAWAFPLIESLGVMALTVVLTIFMLIKRETLRDRLITLVGHGRMVVASKAVDDAGERIARYLFTQFIINCAYALAWAAGLYLIGVKYALLWGAMSAILRYIPYVGTTISTLFPVTMSLAQFPGWQQPIMVVGLFVTLELLTANFIEPRFFGHSIGVSEVAMLVSAAFWTFLWGVTGLVLSGPMTVCLVVLGKHAPQLEFFALLLGNEPTLDTRLSFYQRLLARDQDEATELVLAEIKRSSVEVTYDNLVLPALTYAKRDHEHELLSAADEDFVFHATKDILADIGESVDRQGDKPDELFPNSARRTPRVRIVACAAQDQGDLLALEMLRQVLDHERWDLQVVPLGTLTSELLAQIKDEPVALICIAALPPGGLARCRYLCKRLRARYPNVKILVGRWGLRSNLDSNRDQLLESGANDVATTLLETRDQLNVWLPVLTEELRHALSA